MSDLKVGDLVEVTPEGVTRLCKTKAWKRTGVVTSIKVTGCPECVKVKRGSAGAESINANFLRVVGVPPPPPSAVVRIPLSLTHQITFEGAPIISGIPLKRGLLTDLTKVRMEENGQPVIAQFESLSKWPDGSIKSLLVSVAGTYLGAYELIIGESQTPIALEVAPYDLPGIPSLTAPDGTVYHLEDVVRTVEVQGPVRSVTRYQGNG